MLESDYFYVCFDVAFDIENLCIENKLFDS